MSETNNMKKGTILGLLSTMNYKSKSSLLAGLVLIPILVILVSVLYAYEALYDLQLESNKASNQLINDKTDLIITAITEDYKYAKVQTNLVKDNIVKSLNQEYGDNKELMKNDYLSYNSDSRFYQILSSCISSKYMNRDISRNRMFIATRNKILIDNSLEYYDHSFRDWDEVLAKSEVYQDMLKRSLDQIITQNDNIILWIDTHQKIRNVDDINRLDDSISVFIHEKIANNDIEDLKKFSIVAASYIFEHEDIFGTPDVTSGEFTNNDKLYIIQIFNIGDILDSNDELISSISEYETIAATNYEFLHDAIHYITAFTVFVVVFEIITFFGIWYLVEYYIYSKNKKSKSL